MSSPRRVYAECNIVIEPGLAVKPIRKRTAAVNMDIISSQSVAPLPKEIKLIIKGEKFRHVMELMTTFHQTDEALAEKARASVLADEVEGMTDEEVGTWVRQNIVDELEEMQGGTDEDV